jgi:putative ABC transport system permease protein
MSVVSRGVKNAFRNGLRTGAVALILAISIGMSLSMLVANKAVESRIADLKTEVGRTIKVNPAGSEGFQGGGEPLTADDLAKVKKVADVESATGIMNFTLQTETTDGSTSVFRAAGNATPGKTNLKSSIDAGTLGNRFNARVESGDSSNTNMPEPLLPIRGIGTNGAYDEEGKAFNITSGRTLNDKDTYSTVVGSALAEKNGLKTGSTFTAYDKTFTVVGIVDLGTKFANDTVIFPLKTAQELAGQTSEISTILVQADSIDHLESVMADIKQTLGTSKADVTSSEENIRDAIDSLKSVQNISIVGFIAALAAAGLTVLMVMFVIVRERRREIGVLKAIGGSNRSIVSQFIVEAVVLVAIGGILGLGTAFASSGAIANVLVTSNTSSGSETTTSNTPTTGRLGGGAIRFRASGDSLKDTTELVGKVTTSIGATTLLYGFLGMIAVAILGSAIPAWLIAKVRPSEVLRGE